MDDQRQDRAKEYELYWDIHPSLLTA